MLPKAHDSKDESAESKIVMGKEVRYRQRYLDLIVNSPVRKIFERRNQVIDYLR